MTSLDALLAVGIPAVAIDRIPEGYSGVSVTLDNVRAGRDDVSRENYHDCTAALKKLVGKA